MTNTQIAKERHFGTTSQTVLDISEFIFSGNLDLTKYQVNFIDPAIFKWPILP